MTGANNLHHPVNFATLRDLEETVALGVPSIMLDLINTFTIDCRETFRMLSQALTDGDLKLVEINSHALKSSAATFGAEKLSVLFAEIELAARNHKIDEIRSMMDDVANKIDEVEAALNAELERLK